MDCLKCSGPTRVTDSRPFKGERRIWRKRACKDCGHVFYTHEVPVASKRTPYKRTEESK